MRWHTTPLLPPGTLLYKGWEEESGSDFGGGIVNIKKLSSRKSMEKLLCFASIT
jgi:hypothetical protein